MKMYQITIWKKEGRYFGEIPELNLLASDDDPTALVKCLEEAAAKLSESYHQAGRQLAASPLSHRESRHAFKAPLAFFAVKTSIVAIAASIVIVIAIDTLSDHVRNGFFDGALGPFHLITKIGTRLESMPPQVKEKNLKDLERVVQELEPYMERMRPLVISDSCKK